MEAWQLVSIIVAPILSAIAVVIALSRIVGSAYGRLDTKIDDLAKLHHGLAGDFKELRGEIRTRFGLVDQERADRMIDALKKGVTH